LKNNSNINYSENLNQTKDNGKNSIYNSNRSITNCAGFSFTINESNNNIINFDSLKKELANKILKINRGIDFGKINYFNNELYKDIKDIIKEISRCDYIMNKYQNNILIFETLKVLRMDIIQTCFRYECFINNQEIPKFSSSFEGNKKYYTFNKDIIMNRRI
jgi:hypothetical protein